MQDAVDEVKADREFTRVERDAFQEFRDKIQTLSPHNPRATANSTRSLPVVTPYAGNHEDIDLVREHYQQTVMSVPGSDEVYGESLSEHLSGEFGDDVATVVLDGDTLTKPVQSLLIAKSTESATGREDYLELLGTEYESLLDANGRLRPVRTTLAEINRSRLCRYSFDELAEHEETIREDLETCEDVLETRQHEIHEHTPD